MSDPAGLAHPSLYHYTDDGSICLSGVRCRACGRPAFPYQTYGCENCGAEGDALEPLSLDARGRILSFAEVHRHQGKDIEAPFVIAQLVLEGGVFIRATMGASDARDLRPGQQVTGRLVAGSGTNQEKQELRFIREDY